MRGRRAGGDYDSRGSAGDNKRDAGEAVEEEPIEAEPEPIEPTEPEMAVETKAETVLQSTASVRYALTAAERDEIERVVMAEAGAEPYIGQMAVAQCILNACEQEDKRPLEIVRSFGYPAARPEPSDEVKSAVSDVFDDGDVATDAEILYFYAPELCQSIWHESQTYVCTIGGHRFFEEAAK